LKHLTFSSKAAAWQGFVVGLEVPEIFVVIEELGPSEVDKVGTITPLLETPGSTEDEGIMTP